MTDHYHDHSHDEIPAQSEMGHYANRVRAIRELLIEKGVLTQEDVQREIDYMESRTRGNGARIVARAWVDPAFKERLEADPKAACAELGIDASGINEFVVLGNTEQVRHLNQFILHSSLDIVEEVQWTNGQL